LPPEIPVDIITYTLASSQGNSSSLSREHLTTASQLVSWLSEQSLRCRNGAVQEVFLLVEDVSDDVVQILRDHIGFNDGIIADYTKGRVNGVRREDAPSKLYANRFSSTVLDRARSNEAQKSLK
jgi:hypothetical protein